MFTRVLDDEFALPLGFSQYNGMPPVSTPDPGDPGHVACLYLPGRVLSWYGTQTVKAHNIELLCHFLFRPDAQPNEVFTIWAGHQLTLGTKVKGTWASPMNNPGTQNTILIQSPSILPAFGPGWVAIEYQAINNAEPGENMMFEIQCVFFYL